MLTRALASEQPLKAEQLERQGSGPGQGQGQEQVQEQVQGQEQGQGQGQGQGQTQQEQQQMHPKQRRGQQLELEQKQSSGVEAMLTPHGLEPTANMSYRDVSASAWYADAVAIASAAGIIKGRADGTFGGDDVITREEMAVMLIRAYDVMNDVKGGRNEYGTEDSSAADVENSIGEGTIRPGNLPAQYGLHSRTAIALLLGRSRQFWKQQLWVC